jgi:chromate transporter
MLAEAGPQPSGPSISLGAIARLALRYGLTGFGGGYSVLALLREEVVARRRWVSEADFLVLAELAKTLPGTPAAGILALVGQRLCGTRGGWVVASAFIAPSAAVMIGCGAVYPRLRELPGLPAFFSGMSAAMVAVVAGVTLDLARTALRTRADLLLFALCTALLAPHVVSEPALSLATACTGAAWGTLRARREDGARGAGGGGAGPAALAPSPLFSAASLGALGQLATVFLPIGALTFGGGLAMIPAIEHAAVRDHAWLTPREFADAIALSQITPGPVAICATFVGFRVAGVAGAVVATAAMFGPATALVLFAGRSVDRFHKSPAIRGALRALAPAVIGMLAAAVVSLARTGVHGAPGIAIVSVTLLLVRTLRLHPLLALTGGGLVQLAAAQLLRGPGL